MLKRNIHPILFKTKIFYNNQVILNLFTIKKQIYLDIWSGNHPFYIKMLNKKTELFEENILTFYIKYNKIIT